MIVCPKCGCGYTLIIDSRKDDTEKNLNDYIRRRRVCEECDERFTTYEITKQDFNTLVQFKRLVNKMANNDEKRGI